MEQSPSSEANRLPANQELEPEGSLPHLKVPAHIPILTQINAVDAPILRSEDQS
jgi:hypothetical protein